MEENSMGSFNPFSQMPMAQNFGFAPTAFPQSQTPRIDPNQFRQFAITLNDNHLSQLVQMARQRGISDADIQAGINFIKSL
jgi:hypothetical protein